MVGGIVANNSSGMCCGVSQNTYHTLRDLRVVLADGTVLDTADPASCESFLKVILLPYLFIPTHWCSVRMTVGLHAWLMVYGAVQTHRALADGVSALAKRVQADKQLSALIRRKFSIKCTTGYSLNALVDFPADDPVEIIKRLMIGSEGTLGFVSRATYNTVPEWKHKVAMLLSVTYLYQIALSIFFAGYQYSNASCNAGILTAWF